MLVARFIAALPHGAYFGIASLVAASLMGPGKRARGVALVLSGLTIANVIGVPAITWLGQAAGWRVAYLAVAGIFALTFVAVLIAVPWQPGDVHATMKRELRAFSRAQVWFALGIGAIGFGGLFAVYSYVAPLATDVTGLPPSLVPVVLIVFGVGMTVGNFVGGRLADWSVRRSMYVFFGILAAALVLLGFTAANPVGLFTGVFLVGASSAALSPTIQARLMDVARDSQSIAAALNHSALNIGNSLGALLGGLAIAAGLGYVAPIWIGLVLTIAGVAARARLVRARSRARPQRRGRAVRDRRGRGRRVVTGPDGALPAPSRHPSVGLEQDPVEDRALAEGDLRADVEPGDAVLLADALEVALRRLLGDAELERHGLHGLAGAVEGHHATLLRRELGHGAFVGERVLELGREVGVGRRGRHGWPR